MLLKSKVYKKFRMQVSVADIPFERWGMENLFEDWGAFGGLFSFLNSIRAGDMPWVNIWVPTISTSHPIRTNVNIFWGGTAARTPVFWQGLLLLTPYSHTPSDECSHCEYFVTSAVSCIYCLALLEKGKWKCGMHPCCEWQRKDAQAGWGMCR